MKRYDMGNTMVIVKHYTATNNIVIEDISAELGNALGYVKGELVGASFSKISDHSINLCIEECIDFNDGTVNIVDVLNKAMDFRFININNHSIDCRIRAYSLASSNAQESLVYIKVFSINIQSLWLSFLTNHILTMNNGHADKVAILCKFAGIYNIDSVIISIECFSLKALVHKEPIIRCIYNELQQIGESLFAISYIGDGCFIAVSCGLEEEAVKFLLGKVYKRTQCILANHKLNQQTIIEYNYLLNHGRYALSKVSSINDVLKIATNY